MEKGKGRDVFRGEAIGLSTLGNLEINDPPLPGKILYTPIVKGEKEDLNQAN